MTVGAAKAVYWTCSGLPALVVLLGVLDTLFAGLGGAALFYLAVAASIYLMGTWVFRRDRHA
jgi:hypothetical protein